MKPITAVLMTSLVLGACEKSNDITQLHEQAISVAKYFGPRVDDLAKRRDSIFQRGRNVPGNLPDVPEIVKLIGESSDKIKEMQGIASPSGPDGKSAIEKQADGFLKDAKAEELGKLIDDSQEKLDEDWTIANDDLNKVEGWLWAYEQVHAVVPPSAPPAPSPNNTTEAAPAVGTATTPAEGQPKGENKAAEPAKADDQKAAEPAKADDKKAEDKKAEDKKAGEPKAADKKAGAPAKADDKKAAAPKADDKKVAPKAAAPKADDKKATPKAGSGSAAK
jgi:hypothetical protein